jgi:hypothetical protein
LTSYAQAGWQPLKHQYDTVLAWSLPALLLFLVVYAR